MSNCPIETDFSALLFRPYTGYSEGRQGILKRILHRVLNKSRSDPKLLNCTRPWRNWIAHRSSEPRVVGSNPTGRAFFGHLPTLHRKSISNCGAINKPPRETLSRFEASGLPSSGLNRFSISRTRCRSPFARVTWLGDRLLATA